MKMKNIGKLKKYSFCSKQISMLNFNVNGIPLKKNNDTSNSIASNAQLFCSPYMPYMHLVL